MTGRQTQLTRLTGSECFGCQRTGNRRSPACCEDPSPKKRGSEDGAVPILKPEHTDSENIGDAFRVWEKSSAWKQNGQIAVLESKSSPWDSSP
ncbi:unnamed protein product [Linum tenue]|uniref:Uncharacterized protein n=1 Tax=Linum tenue TaxID=586396 RepID=A0AAV0KUT1_9ROSI|nr:unnamed protein product [Linum tenue]